MSFSGKKKKKKQNAHPFLSKGISPTLLRSATVTCLHARCSLRGTFGSSDVCISALTAPAPL